MDREELVKLIVGRLDKEAEGANKRFADSAFEVGVRYVAIDDLLPVEIATAIHQNFPPVEKMRLMNSFREMKYTSKNFDSFDPLLKDITFAMQDPRVVEQVERITGMVEQIPDSKLYAGGLSAMGKDHFLGPHIDNSHDGERRYYRTLNLLYYVTPNWSFENGGNLELWDETVKQNVTIHSKFNRLVLMETHPLSWHSVNRVRVDGIRECVSNYYFSEQSPAGGTYFHITAFSARPEQKLLRAVAKLDGMARHLLRKVIPSGLGKEDVYK